jgi:glycosyltransferase involved in cell wall biosynthesis
MVHSRLTMAPRFSVVITCFNQKKYVGAAVDSALCQGHRGKEIIVVDDGSADGSREILEAYSDSIRLSAFPENRGAIAARNHGAALASGEYLVFLDGDDLLVPWALDIYENVIAGRSPEIAVGCATWFDGDVPPELSGQDRWSRIKFMDYPTLMAKDRPVWLSASVLVVKRKKFHEVGGWTPGIFHMDLYDIAAKLGQVGRTVCVFSPSTTLYRVHSQNSRKNVTAFVEGALRIIQKEKAGEYPRDSAHMLQRYAWFGGMVIFWAQQAVRAGLRSEAAALVTSGFGMILAAVVRSAGIRIRGRPQPGTFEYPNA